MLNIDKEVRLQ